MPIEVLMPALSPTMTEGTLAKWCKAEGDKVRSGEVIAEIETDKATMEIEASEDGILGKILISAGTQEVKINSAIGILLLKGEDKSVLENIENKTTTESPPSSVSSYASETGEAIPSPSFMSRASSSPKTNDEKRIFASPLAKRIAAQNNVALDLLKGSGPRGRGGRMSAQS